MAAAGAVTAPKPGRKAGAAPHEDNLVLTDLLCALTSQDGFIRGSSAPSIVPGMAEARE